MAGDADLTGLPRHVSCQAGTPPGHKVWSHKTADQDWVQYMKIWRIVAMQGALTTTVEVAVVYYGEVGLLESQ